MKIDVLVTDRHNFDVDSKLSILDREIFKSSPVSFSIDMHFSKFWECI
jgi:hypothetical protein